MPDINAAYGWSIQTCNAANIGYSQPYRNQKKVNGITYYDCSSFINYALLAGGFTTPGYAPDHNAFTTSTEPNVLLQLGFKEVDAKGAYIAGDIGWSVGHTEMCYRGGQGKGIFMGAHTSKAELANQVSIGSSSGNPNYERSFDRLFRYGDSPAVNESTGIYVCAAICGNFWQESGINPGLWEGITPPEPDRWDMHILNKGYGLGQWTNTGGDANGRLWKMHEWVSAQDPYNTDNGTNQVKYIGIENYWISNSDYPDFPNLESFMTSQSTDLAYLTHAWNQCWEGIHDASWDVRVEYAQKCFDYIQANITNTGMFDGWYLGDRYLTEAERLNNVMMVYNALGGWGDEGEITEEIKGMPLWMKLRRW